MQKTAFMNVHPFPSSWRSVINGVKQDAQHCGKWEIGITFTSRRQRLKLRLTNLGMGNVIADSDPCFHVPLMPLCNYESIFHRLSATGDHSCVYLVDVTQGLKVKGHDAVLLIRHVEHLLL